MGCSCEHKKEIGNTVKVLKTSSSWKFNDYWGAAFVRMSIGRNSYRVEPGLYQLGEPDKKSDVLVSANYKLSFDILRKNLVGMNAWILVLDTKGINVWCAAGKGTFGTDELIKQIQQSNLHEVVNHRRLIVPQLGAPGIAAFRIKESTGFNVKYGPVLAKDIKSFISASHKASESMRTVLFNFKDRLILAPVEIANSLKYLVLFILFFIIISGLNRDGYSLSLALEHGLISSMIILTAYISGAFLTPILLPWLPSRYFAAKGMVASGIMFIGLIILNVFEGHAFSLAGWLLLSLAISSFLAMNFTGATTYTSLSGVKKEMKLFVPIQLGFTIFGFIFILISKFSAL